MLTNATMGLFYRQPQISVKIDLYFVCMLVPVLKSSMTGCGLCNMMLIRVVLRMFYFIPSHMHSRLVSISAEKYDYVGRLLKPGDEPSEYTDEEDIKDHLKHD